MKKLATLSLSALIAFSLVACGEEPAPTIEPTPEVTQEQVQGGGTQVPNPFVQYDTVAEGTVAAGYTLAELTILPEGYTASSIRVAEGELGEIIYTSETQSITLRTAEGSDDISGDYTMYDTVESVTIGEQMVETRGTQGVISMAIWATEDTTHAISFGEAVTLETFTALFETIG